MDSPVGLWSHTKGRSKTVFLTALLFPVFVVPIVFLRCWTSQIILGKWHLDDRKYAAAPFYNLTTFFTKSSILAFYLRFSIERSFHFYVYTITIVMGAYSIANTITVLVLDCHNRGAYHLIHVIFDILRPMTISTGRKLAIALVLMAGGLYIFRHNKNSYRQISNKPSVIAVSIVRLIATITVDNDSNSTYSWGLTILLRRFCDLVYICSGNV
ncbi:hypothetical protein B0I35DRAFT_471903 [Stachybotrys elegans]|uniref:Rhodopsin domain-containing protein n=1 Tax=Stachybotrys elegans TaxID=80388 RepID=A0A8K0SA90_9HYPO|nr:hypothetical protein B0I35DRAFT_471903 [Stachybotrys elegans]